MQSPGKVYLEYNFQSGWPSGTDLYYECEKCFALVLSTESTQCECGNVYVDAQAGRAGAGDESKVRLVKLK